MRLCPPYVLLYILGGGDRCTNCMVSPRIPRHMLRSCSSHCQSSFVLYLEADKVTTALWRCCCSLKLTDCCCRHAFLGCAFLWTPRYARLLPVPKRGLSCGPGGLHYIGLEEFLALTASHFWCDLAEGVANNTSRLWSSAEAWRLCCSVPVKLIAGVARGTGAQSKPRLGRLWELLLGWGSPRLGITRALTESLSEDD